MLMGWDGIEEFVAVATAKSFVKAAAALDVSSSHVSRAVSALEQRIQAQLLFRTTRTVTLTDRGRVFFEQCRRLIAERDEALAMVSENAEPVGELKVTCPTAMGERFIAPLVLRYCEKYPKISASLEMTNRLVDLVAEGFDLAIRTGHLESSSLVGTSVGTRRFVTCASADYLQRAGQPATPDDLDRHQCVVGTASTWLFRDAGGVRSFRARGRWRCNGGDSVVEATLAGLGLCHLPEFYVRRHVKAGTLVPVLEVYRRDDEPVWAVYPRQRHPLPKVRFLIDHLRANLPTALIAD